MPVISSRRAADPLPRSVRTRSAIAAIALAVSGAAFAGEHRHDSLPAAENKLWHAECSVCHVAYPPGLLPERSWRAIMDGLDRHFGENASLDPADRRTITEFLAANAADRVDNRWAHQIAAATPAGRTPLRITEFAWFERKHDELRAEVWKRKEVGSPANCGACHPGAEKGRFDEAAVVVPGSARHRD